MDNPINCYVMDCNKLTINQLVTELSPIKGYKRGFYITLLLCKCKGISKLDLVGGEVGRLQLSILTSPL